MPSTVAKRQDRIKPHVNGALARICLETVCVPRAHDRLRDADPGLGPHSRPSRASPGDNNSYHSEPTAFMVQNRDVACKGAISFYDNGVFRLATLVEDSYFSVQGRAIVFMADRIVRFTDEAVLYMGTLVEDTAFELWGQEVLFQGGTQMVFHPGGDVLTGYLRNDMVFEVNGREITIPASSQEAGIFSRTGHPSFMNNLRDVVVEIRGQSVVIATTSFEYADLLFRPDGGILQGTLAGDTELETREGPVTYPARTVITFDDEGFAERAEELIPYEM